MVYCGELERKVMSSNNEDTNTRHLDLQINLETAFSRKTTQCFSFIQVDTIRRKMIKLNVKV